MKRRQVGGGVARRIGQPRIPLALDLGYGWPRRAGPREQIAGTDWLKEAVVMQSKNFDWSECPLVETKPGVLGGTPVLRGTRMPVSAIVDNFAFGLSVAEISEQFEVSQHAVREILGYAQST